MVVVKKIHQIWFQGKDVPKKYKDNISSLKQINRDWKYKLWSDEDMKKECLNYSKECFDKYMKFEHMHQKIDLGRYVILYNNGGFSVDIDVKPLKSLNTTPQLNKNKLIVSKIDLNKFETYIFLRNNMLCNNAHIYSPKYNNSLKKIIDKVIDHSPRLYTNKMNEIMYTTGPIIFTNNLDEEVTLLNYKYFEPRTINRNEKIDETTILIHEMSNTWINETYRPFILFYLNNREYIKYILIAILLILVYLLYFMRRVKQ